MMTQPNMTVEARSERVDSSWLGLGACLVTLAPASFYGIKRNQHPAEAFE